MDNYLKALFALSVFFALSSQPLISLLKLNPFFLSLVIILVYFLSCFKSIHVKLKKHDKRLLSISLLLACFSFLVNHVSGGTLILLFFVFVIFGARLLLEVCKANRLINYFLVVQFAVIICAMIALISHLYFSSSPVLFVNDIFNDRKYFWMPFSFSVSDGDVGYTNTYRPSGIYDEPGALLYASSLIAIFAILLAKELKISFYLISFATIISGSFAGLYSTVLIFFGSQDIRKVYKLLPFLMLFSVLLLHDEFILRYFTSNFIERLFNSYNQGMFEARSVSIENSFRVFDNFEFFLLGAPKDFLNTGGDPLTILVGYGVFPWILYLYIIFALLVFFLGGWKKIFIRDPVSLCSLLLLIQLLQRPYIFNVFWAIPTIAAFLAISEARDSVCRVIDRSISPKNI